MSVLLMRKAATKSLTDWREARSRWMTSIASLLVLSLRSSATTLALATSRHAIITLAPDAAINTRR